MSDHEHITEDVERARQLLEDGGIVVVHPDTYRELAELAGDGDPFPGCAVRQSVHQQKGLAAIVARWPEDLEVM